MLKYIKFAGACLFKKFNFFKLTDDIKANVLFKYELYFWAGLLYGKLNNYEQAVICFENCNAPKQLFISYQKCGRISAALQLAEEKKYYEQGAKLSLKYQNYNKAAYFYSFCDPAQGAKYYLKINKLYEAGICYLSAGKYTNAINCFKQCPSPSQCREGLTYAEEMATILYFKHHYKQAFKIFTALQDFDSALICAYALNDDNLIEETHNFLGHTPPMTNLSHAI
ncbi:MAG: hypothetical protein ATN36_07555 [Epulopiscium sp. Nele67-Bin005]|nr:MAG: hypothetical protein ATN36_07555 [Epulopiscium sp. Nele67-Bin005]